MSKGTSGGSMLVRRLERTGALGQRHTPGNRHQEKEDKRLWGGDGHASSRRQAEDTDRADRLAWGYRFRSAYSGLLHLPASVNRADYEAARHILGRIREAVAQGGWTRAEWRRLRVLEERWAARAAGRDPTFNQHGWRAHGGGPKVRSPFSPLTDITTRKGYER